MSLTWKHALVMVLIVAAAYYTGSKHPGWLTKLSMGTVSA